MAETSNLRARMLAAMGDIGRVEKKGRNTGQGYNYTKADDIILECREALIKHGIVFLSSETSQDRLPDRESKSGGAILGVVVKMQFTLMDTTSDEKLVADHSGEGMDSGDKATNKAKTAALKYFLQQTFLIPTGDDPEKEDHDVKPVSNAFQNADCPTCGMANTVRKGAPQFGGGYFCDKKKGGCGARFKDKPEPPAGPDPADTFVEPEPEFINQVESLNAGGIEFVSKVEVGKLATRFARAKGAGWDKNWTTLLADLHVTKDTMTLAAYDAIAAEIDPLHFERQAQ